MLYEVEIKFDSDDIKELEIDTDNSYILNHNWHGNVRELRNLIERIAILQPNTKEKISSIIKESLNFITKVTYKICNLNITNIKSSKRSILET